MADEAWKKFERLTAEAFGRWITDEWGKKKPPDLSGNRGLLDFIPAATCSRGRAAAAVAAPSVALRQRRSCGRGAAAGPIGKPPTPKNVSGCDCLDRL